MSIETANTFKAMAEQDSSLRADTLAAYNVGGYPAVSEFAAGRGYAFGPADAEAVMAAPAAEGEMSDLELEAVAGGKKKVSTVINQTNQAIANVATQAHQTVVSTVKKYV